jgi:hypothetical protein
MMMIQPINSYLQSKHLQLTLILTNLNKNIEDHKEYKQIITFADVSMIDAKEPAQMNEIISWMDENEIGKSSHKYVVAICCIITWDLI